MIQIRWEKHILIDCTHFNNFVCKEIFDLYHSVFYFLSRLLLSIVLVWRGQFMYVSFKLLRAECLSPPLCCCVFVKSSVLGQRATKLEPQIRPLDKEGVVITILPPTLCCSISYLNPYRTTQASLLQSLSFCSTVGHLSSFSFSLTPLFDPLILLRPLCLSLPSSNHHNASVDPYRLIGEAKWPKGKWG